MPWDPKPETLKEPKPPLNLLAHRSPALGLLLHWASNRGTELERRQPPEKEGFGRRSLLSVLRCRAVLEAIGECGVLDGLGPAEECTNSLSKASDGWKSEVAPVPPSGHRQHGTRHAWQRASEIYRNPLGQVS